jgi:Uri superfamily endonuclease
MRKGIYQLLIHLPKSMVIPIGRKGRFKFPKGYFIYTGSARRGFDARVGRHLRKEKRHFWHIDYLLDHASVKQVFLFPDDGREECSLAKKMLRRPEAEVIVPRFGASDCNCQSHLVFFRRLKDVPLKQQN